VVRRRFQRRRRPAHDRRVVLLVRRDRGGCVDPDPDPGERGSRKQALVADRCRRGQMLLRDLGPSVSAITTSVASARVEALAGELAAAEAELRRDETDLAQLGERYFRSSIAASLARVLVLEAKVDEAERFAELAAELAEPDDVDPQIIWRSVRSRILAAQGDAETALRLSNEAIELTRETDDLLQKAEALLDRSAVLTALGRTDEAGAALAQALALYEQKGDAVSAARIREALAVPAS
jgi:ATP/maltotriose-dependent transcriptional regulator MalT